MSQTLNNHALFYANLYEEHNICQTEIRRKDHLGGNAFEIESMILSSEKPNVLTENERSLDEPTTSHNYRRSTKLLVSSLNTVKTIF